MECSVSDNADSTVVQYMGLVRALVAEKQQQTGRVPLAFTHHYGCQQNVSDGEKLDGMLAEMGYAFCNSPEEADLVLYNTCAIRENAEDRIFGNVGALKSAKRNNPDMVICLCGCMVQQEHIADKLKRSYPYVDLVFGPSALPHFPQLLWEHIHTGQRVFQILNPTTAITEGLPLRREGIRKVWVPIMYGCDNFCSFCVVPLVRGRERSRSTADILVEIKGLVAQGCREITLLGQNVNSYRCGDADFVSLLRQINEIPGDYRVRFMTSHPKDCSQELLRAMAECTHVVKHLHLPVQSGCDRVLAEMNRRYTIAQYKEKIDYAREICPGMTFTSDIIVGFPGETYAELQETIALLREVRYLSLFTFVYSRREGTRAARMDDPVPEAEKKQWFQELLAVQNQISRELYEELVGQTLTVLVEGPAKAGDGLMSGRSEANLIVDFPAAAEDIGQFRQVTITKALNWALAGEIVR